MVEKNPPVDGPGAVVPVFDGDPVKVETVVVNRERTVGIVGDIRVRYLEQDIVETSVLSRERQVVRLPGDPYFPGDPAHGLAEHVREDRPQVTSLKTV